MPPAEAHGVVTFYHLFSLEPRPLAVAHVCDDIACRIKGAEQLCTELEHSLGPESEGLLDNEARAWVVANRLPLRWYSMRASHRMRSRSLPRRLRRSWPRADRTNQ